MPANKKAGESAEARIKGLEEENRALVAYRKLVEETSDLIWEVDENGVNTYMSPKISEVLGYGPEELVGKRPFDFMVMEEAKFMAEVFESIAAERKIFSFSCLENINLHKDGHEVVLETSAVPFVGPDGTFKGYRGIDRVVTRRRRAEDEFVKTNIELQDSFNEIKLKSGLAPICSSCKRVLTEKGWGSVKEFVAGHSEAQFSNSICHDCAGRMEEEKAA